MILTHQFILLLAPFILWDATISRTTNKSTLLTKNTTARNINSFRKKLYTGKNCTDEEFTHLVQILDDDYNINCSGTLLNPWTVLTAAQCYRPRDNMTVLAGYSQHSTRFSQKSKVVKVYLGWNYYSPNKVSYDIAIFGLRTPIYPNKFISYTKYSTSRKSTTCSKSVIKVWEEIRASKDRLRCTEVPIINSSK